MLHSDKSSKAAMTQRFMKSYFSLPEGAPSPLRIEVERRIRFEEVDSLGVVWHGRYPSLFEDAREALGERYGVSYLDFLDHGILVPIKRLHVDHRSPLRYKETAAIEGILHWSEAARINYEFIIKDGTGRVAATGYTVQMMLDLNRNVCMIPPPFYAAFLEKWKAGEIE